MLTAFLQAHPMRELLSGGTRVLWPPADDRRAWEAILPGYRREIRELAEEYAKIPYPIRSASGFLAFARTGDRQADEKPYFERRRKLCVSVLVCCVSEEATLTDVIDGVWCADPENTDVVKNDCGTLNSVITVK